MRLFKMNVKIVDLEMSLHFTFIIGGYRRPLRKINILNGEKLVWDKNPCDEVYTKKMMTDRKLKCKFSLTNCFYRREKCLK